MVCSRIFPFPLGIHGRKTVGGEAEPKLSIYQYAERGKPVFLLLWRESPSQDEPMGMQVREHGKSECRAVMVRIGVETSPHAKSCRLP